MLVTAPVNLKGLLAARIKPSATSDQQERLDLPQKQPDIEDFRNDSESSILFSVNFKDGDPGGKADYLSANQSQY